MSGFQDVRDVMDIHAPAEGSSVPRPHPKKQKTVEKRPDGITRELFALLGENPPPVAIVENKFKEKPRWMGKATPWVMKGFTNPARRDGLVLHHWERKTDAAENLSYQFAKFNIQVDVPTYTDAEYEAVQDPNWSREETDYLFSLCREYDLRFPIIWDRYAFPGGVPRTVEDIKARYYGVCRTLMELRTPPNQMTPEQSVQYNLLNFNKEQEVARKKRAERLFNRSPEEIKEEELLLAELKRIVSNQEAMLEERRELFQRLNVPAASGSIAAYAGSQGISHLRDIMMSTTDKSKKRKSIAMSQANGVDPSSSHAGASAERGGGGGGGGGGAAGPAAAPVRKQMRKLTEEEEEMYGVTYHDKLTSGIKFRSAMVATNPKGVSTQKSMQALAQLGIGAKLAMPTAKSVAKYEQLQAAVANLLDTKKLLEKLEQEARVLKAQSAKTD